MEKEREEEKGLELQCADFLVEVVKFDLRSRSGCFGHDAKFKGCGVFDDDNDDDDVVDDMCTTPTQTTMMMTSAHLS